MTLRNPLQELDHIHATKQTRDDTLTYVLNRQLHQKQKYWSRGIIAVATISVCILFLFMQPKEIKRESNTVIASTTSYVSFDVNPSMEWELNEQYQVIAIRSFNEDAKLLLAQLDIMQLSLADALHNLFKNESYLNYLQEGILEVGVFSKSKTNATEIEKAISSYLGDTLPSGTYHCANIDEGTHSSASDHHMSSGKYRVIEQIMKHDTSHTLQQLKNMSMQELYQLLQPYDPSAVPEKCEQRKERQRGNNHHNKGC